MLHKLSARSATSFPSPIQNEHRLHLARPQETHSAVPSPDLFLITVRRCSAFCAEAAVLVLVFGLLDYFMMKGHIEPLWSAGALVISVALLGLSIAMDLSAHRWLKAHP